MPLQALIFNLPALGKSPILIPLSQLSLHPFPPELPEMPVEVISLISDEEPAPTPTRRGVKRRRTSAIPTQLSAPTDDEVIVVSHTKRGTKDLSAAANVATTKIEDDIECVGEQRGVVVLADYPHFRFQCAKSPQVTRGGKKNRFCKQCFCYVCDIPAAECSKWSSHEHARDTSSRWRAKRTERIERRRTERRNIRAVTPSFPTLPRTFTTNSNNYYRDTIRHGRRKRIRTIQIADLN